MSYDVRSMKQINTAKVIKKIIITFSGPHK
jgi:hypothetical protein